MTAAATPVDLVLEGGGVKGIGLLGAVLEMSEAGYWFPRIAGTSAGAIVAALVASYQRAGRDLHDLEKVMRDVHYDRFADGPLLEKLTGRVGEAVALLLHGGAHSGAYLTEWLGPLLKEVGVETFSDLSLDDRDSSLAPHQRYSLVVHASDLSRRVLVRLPWDYPEYGCDPTETRVVDAVHASMAIPFYFRPVRVDTARGSTTWVDGGLLSNFPITVFDRTDGRTPRWETWGVRLSAPPRPGPDVPVRTVAGLAVRALQTLTGDWDRYRHEEAGVGRRTVRIDTAGVSSTDFSIGPESQQALFDAGRRAASAFLVSHESRL